jgi:hypothetical protein
MRFAVLVSGRHGRQCYTCVLCPFFFLSAGTSQPDVIMALPIQPAPVTGTFRSVPMAGPSVVPVATTSVVPVASTSVVSYANRGDNVVSHALQGRKSTSNLSTTSTTSALPPRSSLNLGPGSTYAGSQGRQSFSSTPAPSNTGRLSLGSTPAPSNTGRPGSTYSAPQRPSGDSMTAMRPSGDSSRSALPFGAGSYLASYPIGAPSRSSMETTGSNIQQPGFVRKRIQHWMGKLMGRSSSKKSRGAAEPAWEGGAGLETSGAHGSGEGSSGFFRYVSGGLEAMMATS